MMTITLLEQNASLRNPQPLTVQASPQTESFLLIIHSLYYCPTNNLQSKQIFQLYNLEEEQQKMGCGVAMCVMQNREMLNLNKDSKSYVSTLKPQNQNIRVNISPSSLTAKKENVIEMVKVEGSKEECKASVGKENIVEVGKQNTLVVQVKEKEKEKEKQKAKPKPEVKESQKINESKPETREVNDRFNKFQKQKATAQTEKKDVPKPKQLEAKIPEKKQKTPIKTNRTQQAKQKQVKQTPKQTSKQTAKEVVKQASKQTKIEEKVQKVQKVQDVQNVQKQFVVTGKRQSMNIQDIKGIETVTSPKKSEEEAAAIPNLQKKASSKNLYKNDISRKSLKIRKEMTPVDSLFLQSVITRPQEPVIESDIKETKPTPTNQSKVEIKPENVRNLPPSRKGRNEPIQIVENLVEIDKNLDVQKVPKKISQQAIIPKQKIVPAKKEGTASKIEEKTAKKISESKKGQDQEKKAVELKKKVEEQNRKAQEQKRLLETKKKIQLQEKKAIEMQTSKLKKVYNV